MSVGDTLPWLTMLGTASLSDAVTDQDPMRQSVDSPQSSQY